MADRIRAGIFGYGNIGRSAERAIMKTDDITPVAVFTRRDPENIETVSGIKAVSAERVFEFRDEIDVILMCGGSATDLPVQTPELAGSFSTVDMFDTHAKIPEYMDAVGKAAEKGNKAAVVSSGWDPGLFSMMRSLFGSVLPDGVDNTFWGPGVSQGHSDAVRKVDGVEGGIQYTVPSENVLDEVRKGPVREYGKGEKHRRICYIVPKEDADREKIADSIRSMPDYFAGYDTEVNFITADELRKDHSKMPHGGHVLRNGVTGENERHVMELCIKMESNSGFTASVMVAYARAAFRLCREGNYGAKTVLDIPLSYLSPKSREQLIKELL
jgi:diaminopimelate dehydrogenase